ncbi:hypothetical protein HKD37_12G033493 [Glycine soja]
MQPNLFPFGSVLGNPFIFNGDGDLSEGGGGIESSRVFFLLPFFLLSQGGAMDLSKVGEKILSSVRSARSLGLLPPVSDRPEEEAVTVLLLMRLMRVLGLMILVAILDIAGDAVAIVVMVPARAAAAAAVARALAGLPPHQRYSLSSSSEELSSIYGSIPQGQVVEELEDEFYEEVLLAVSLQFQFRTDLSCSLLCVLDRNYFHMEVLLFNLERYFSVCLCLLRDG